jgi:tRNA A-37 threonylcarbamoyl transferase component Bud32
MTAEPPATSLTRLPDPYAVAIRAAYVTLIFLIWAIIIAGIPEAVARASSIAPEIRQMFVERGLPENFDAFFRIGLDFLSLIVFTAMAAFLLVRRGDDWMALYIGMMLMLTCFIYSNSSYDAGFFLWVNVLLTALGETSQVMFFYLFPTGRFIPRWSRWLVIPLLIFRFLIWANIHINDVDQGAIEVGIVVLLMLIGMGHQIYRYRKLSTPVQRQQVKWLLVGLGITVPLVAGYIYVVNIAHLFGPENASNYFLLRTLRVLEQIGLFIFPLSLIFSIVRYRLWDIDVAINKSLVYTAITILLAIPFIAVFWATQAFLRTLLGDSHAEIAIAISGIVVGVLFNPAHKQAQNFIDRRFYRLRFDLNELNKGQGPARVKVPGLLTGRRLNEYEVLDVIGHGGMGEVYRGLGKDRVVAIKVLPQKFAGQSDFRKRFAREAETMTLLEHPNIVRMYDYGETDDGIPYMAMEYVEGQELSDLLRERGQLPFETVLPFIREFAAALDYAHSKGFVHRDIKPSNIMVRSDEDGQLHPVLMDFGVAKIQDAHTHLTGTGAVGTIDYMAPEQIREAGSVDNRADIYAMGLVLYEILTGQRPFQGNPAQVMFAHLQQPAPDPRKTNPDIPGRVANTILRALAKRPDDRYSSAQAMTLALT